MDEQGIREFLKKNQLPVDCANRAMIHLLGIIDRLRGEIEKGKLQKEGLRLNITGLIEENCALQHLEDITAPYMKMQLENKHLHARLVELQTDYALTVKVAGENLKLLATVEAENSVLREQNFAMNKRLSDIGKAVEPIETRLKRLFVYADVKLWSVAINVDDLRNLIAAVKEGE